MYMNDVLFVIFKNLIVEPLFILKTLMKNFIKINEKLIIMIYYN